VLRQSTSEDVAKVLAYCYGEIHQILTNSGLEGSVLRSGADPAGLPLLAAILSVFFFVLTPVNNTFIRTDETEADIFGLNAAREPDGMAEVALILSEYRKISPGPVEEWIFFDHPSGRNRIHMAMRWKAEHLGDLKTPELKTP